MVADTQVNLRLSSLRVGTKANPRLVWSVGVDKEFLEQVPAEQQKARLEAKDGKLLIQLGQEGVKLSHTVKGNYAWASSMGERHLKGLRIADSEMPAQQLLGMFNPQTQQIEVQGELPETVVSSFIDMEEVRRVTDTEAHFPAQHFQEDIQEELLAEAHDLSSPEGAAAWFNNRVKMGAKSVHTEQATLTPALADVLIEHNSGNRPLRIAKLAQYVDDIQNDRWEFNGETIIISREGLMNNGQHRSYAVQETQIGIPVLFVFGVDRNTRKTVDTGANRGPHDQLSADGFAQPTTMAAIARFILSYENNEGSGFANLNRISGPDVYERARGDALVNDAACYPYKHGSKAKRLAPPSVMGFCYYEFMKISEQDAKTFLDQVVTGVGLAADSAAYVTREKLLELSGLHREQKIELLFRGFVAYRRGKPIKSLRVKWELPQL